MVLVTSCGCDETMNQNQLGGDRVYFSLHCQVTVHHWRSQGKNTGRNLETETMKESCLLACSPWLTWSVFLYSPELRGQKCTTHSGLGSLTWLVKKMPHWHACKLIWWGQFSTEVPSFQVTLVCVNLTRLINTLAINDSPATESPANGME